MGNLLDIETQEKQFLDLIFADALEAFPALRLLIWTKPGAHGSPSDSIYFDSTKDAGEFCRRWREKRDIYFGLGLRPDNLDSNHRGTEKQVLGVPGIAMDFDVRTESGKQKTNPFESREEILELVGSLRNPPSVMVQSGGGGVHAYWLFREFTYFENEQEWDYIRRISLGWHRHIKAKTARTIDSTGTLDRVWRIPGTYNHKKEPILVELLVNDGYAYDPQDDFGMFVATKEELRDRVRFGEELRVIVNRQVDLPPDALVELASSIEFAKLWHQIRSLPSQSEYDLALANYARGKLWSIDEALAVIVANRRVKDGDMKIGNDQYYGRTLEKVFGNDIAIEDAPETSKPINAFGRVVGMHVLSLFRYGEISRGQKSVIFYARIATKDEPGGEEIRIGTIMDFRKQTVWRDIRAIHSPGQKPEALSKKAFDNIVDDVMPHALDKTSKDEKGDVLFLSTLDAYLVELRPPDYSGKTFEEISAHTRRGKPFSKDKCIFFTRADFAKWVGENSENGFPDMTSRLSRAGMKRQNIFIKTGEDSSTSKSYYWISREIMNERIKELLEDE